VTGRFQGTLDFGSGPLTSKGGTEVFLASYSSSGVFRWSKASGSALDDAGRRIAVDPPGNVLATGFFAQSRPDR